jgi:hypothetical protein
MAERRILPDELAVVRWLLANAANKDVSDYEPEALEGSSVVQGCTCGCASIDFVYGEPAKPEDARRVRRANDIIAEGFALWPDGARAGVMLWGSEGRFLGIELYDLGGGEAMRRFPTLQVLRRWEDYYPAEPSK